MKNSKKSKKFHQYKKNIYKASMQEYQEFLEKHNIKNNDLPFYSNLEKHKFSDEQITDDLEAYINKISNILEILVYNLSLGIRMMKNKKSVENDELIKLNNYANSINKLSHLKLFDEWQNINQLEILSTLVIAMELSIQRESIYVDLSVD